MVRPSQLEQIVMCQAFEGEQTFLLSLARDRKTDRIKKLIDWLEKEAKQAQFDADLWIDGCEERSIDLQKADNLRMAAEIIKSKT